MFASVFVGSLLGAGITLITSPGSGRDLKGKVRVTIEIIKESVNEHLDNAALMLIENGSVLMTRTKIKLADAKTGKFSFLLGSAKERIQNIKNTLKK